LAQALDQENFVLDWFLKMARVMARERDPSLLTGSGSPGAEASPLHADSLGTTGPYLQVTGPVLEPPSPNLRVATACPIRSSLDLGGEVRSSEAQLPLTTSLRAMEAASLPAAGASGAELRGGASGAAAAPPWRKIGIKICVTISVFLLVSCLLEKYAQGPVTRFSQKLMSQIGLPGLFLGVLIADGVPQPFTYVPLIFMAVKGSVAKSTVFCICASASYVAAMFGYGVGYLLRKPQWGRAWCQKISDDYPYLPELMRQRGAIGVLLAAMLPVPLALATWLAGFFAVSFPSFLLAALGRCPKILVFVLLSGGPGDIGDTA